jgi:sulfate/thiosulfate transport system ATP-binding protein
MNTISSAPSRSPRFWPDLPSSPSSSNPSWSGAIPTDSLARASADKNAVSITVEGVAKRFGTTAALEGVDLDVRPGELVALLGPSGSGKTTLLRVVAGLEQPDAGRVLFGQEDATRLPVQARRVGFVFQHYALFRHMTVASNIAYGLSVRPRHTRPAAAEIRRRVTELLDLVQLSGLEKRFPAQLSGGQRQRVALARALAVEPRVLLLDEPFGALDAQVRHDLRRWLREIHDRTGHTTLFVTHDQDEALELADRVAIFNRGRIEQIATPDEVCDAPATAFVAGFIGEAVRLPAIVDERSVRVGRHIIEHRSNLPSGPADLFLRPREVRLAEPGEPSLAARVVTLRRSAAHRRAELSLGEELPTIEMELPPALELQRGAEVAVAFSAIRLFPSATAG